MRGGWLVVAGFLIALPARGEDTPKVLLFTKSQGFEHPVVHRKGDQLGLAERTIVEIGKQRGFEVTPTKDGTQINAGNLKNYQALFFFTQGELTELGLDRQPPMKKEDRESILEFVRNGGGFVGTHCGGADTFHRWEDGGKKPFAEMVGGEFIGHGPQQKARIEVVDASFPAMKPWDKSFPLIDEWYAYRGFHANMHVLMMLQTAGLTGKDYKRDSYPITWCSQYGKGRVFYTGLGHREDVWQNPKYQEMVGTAVLWVLGKLEGDCSPNLKQLFGDEAAALARINPRAP